MSEERLEQLHAMLAEEPGDAFLRYAIALEHRRRGEMEQAIAGLESLLADDPAHIASYYQLALLLADADRITEAIAACEAGALRCIIAGERKARAELLALKASLEDAL
ncbi:MAG: hypothetical protein KIT10_03785 [Flavobacteriales bacterium]|nr:hypothetical protein [Flavobacteriales bacterium]